MHRPSPLLAPDEVAAAVSQLKEQGKIKNFGLSNFTASQTALVASSVEVSANQLEISITERSALDNGSLDYMMTNGITPMSWSPLGSVFREETPQSDRIKKALKPLCEKYNATQDQLLLAWLLKHPAGIHPVIGTTTASRITNAVLAEKIALSLKDWFTILEASVGEEVA